MVHILLMVDNDKAFLDAVKNFLENEGFFVITALDSSEAQRSIENRKIDPDSSDL